VLCWPPTHFSPLPKRKIVLLIITFVCLLYTVLCPEADCCHDVPSDACHELVFAASSDREALQEELYDALAEEGAHAGKDAVALQHNAHDVVVAAPVETVDFIYGSFCKIPTH
jgi:hypothetical protein